MKNFFNRREEENEEFMEEDELNIIDLDETTGWSKLAIAEELAKQQAANLMEEIGDELAIIDVVEDDVEIDEVAKTAEINVKEIEKITKLEEQIKVVDVDKSSKESQKKVAKGNITFVDLDEMEESDLSQVADRYIPGEDEDIEHITEEEDDIEYITDDEEDLEYMAEDED